MNEDAAQLIRELKAELSPSSEPPFALLIGAAERIYGEQSAPRFQPPTIPLFAKQRALCACNRRDDATCIIRRSARPWEALLRVPHRDADQPIQAVVRVNESFIPAGDEVVIRGGDVINLVCLEPTHKGSNGSKKLCALMANEHERARAWRFMPHDSASCHAAVMLASDDRTRSELLLQGQLVDPAEEKGCVSPPRTTEEPTAKRARTTPATCKAV